MNNANARFWTRGQNGLVKITLKPGQLLSWHEFHYTDEGYSSSWETWRHCGDYIEREYGARARDCDGPIETYHMDICEIDKLNGTEGNFPAWQNTDDYVIDHFAQLMNY